MSRLEKKCFLGSAVLHGLLVVIVLVGSAFLVEKPKSDDSKQLVFLNAKAVDALVNGGGNPNITPEPPRPTPPPVPVAPTPLPVDPPKPVVPVVPKAEKVEVVVKKPDPPKDSPKLPEGNDPRQPKLAKDEPKAKDTPTKHVVKIDTNLVKRVNRPDTKAAAQAKAATDTKAQTDAQARLYAQQVKTFTARQKALATAFGNAQTSLNQSITPGTTVDLSGPGGPAFVNYSSLVRAVYDAAWLVSPDIADDDGSAKVRIVVTSDGRVESARIIGPSGNPALDKSVQRAIDTVRFIAPFPDGAKEAQRTFTINFNLQAKRQTG